MHNLTFFNYLPALCLSCTILSCELMLARSLSQQTHYMFMFFFLDSLDMSDIFHWNWTLRPALRYFQDKSDRAFLWSYQLLQGKRRYLVADLDSFI